MRVLFVGTPEFAVPSLQALLQHGYEVVGLITQPDRPAGRGQKLAAPPVKKLAAAANLPVLQPAKLRQSPETLRFLEEQRPQLMVVAAFGQILPPPVFNFPPLGTINVHASLLPAYRGAAPVAHALIQGEAETGVTIMKLDQGMDTGDILTQWTVPIDENVTAGELEKLLALKGAQLLIQTIPGYARGEIHPQPQDHRRATYAPRIKKEDARIDWNLAAPRIHNRVRGLHPWPVAFTGFRGERIKIWRSRKLSAQVSEARAVGGSAGEILAIGREEIVVQCGERTQLALQEVQLPNRDRIAARDFANGVDLKVGEIFG